MRKMWGRLLSIILLVVAVMLVLPATAFAHGGDSQPAAYAGPLSWIFLGFGLSVIAVVAAILFSGKTQESSVQAFEGLAGFRGYIGKMRLFSRNARLYMVHVVGMDVIYGTWEVVFNLYLLAVGFDIAFVGLRVLLRSIAVAVMSIPAGMISDRIGRKLSFVLGDGMGALTSLIAIFSANPVIILTASVVGGAFGSLHGVAEPAFMAENSRDYERVHLFSVAGGTRTAAMIIGSALAGLVPLTFASADNASLVGVYRGVASVGIAIWFASLIPALMLRQTAPEAEPADKPAAGLRALFANIKHPDRILKLTLPSAVIALGAGFVLPLMNVYFQEGLGSEEIEISAVFSVGQGILVVASFLAPLVASRLGKIRSIVITQLTSVPFIVLLGFAPEAGGALGSVLVIAGIAYILRITTMNMAGPILSAFSMEILDPGERGTQVGIAQAAGAGLSGLAGFLGAGLMNGGDFRTPFVIMAGLYLVAIALFWVFFYGREAELAPLAGEVAGAGVD